MVEGSRDGLNHKAIARHMHVVPERVRQVEQRALTKVAVTNALLELLEPIRTALAKHGARLEVSYPRSNDPGGVYVLLGIRIPKPGNHAK